MLRTQLRVISIDDVVFIFCKGSLHFLEQTFYLLSQEFCLHYITFVRHKSSSNHPEQPLDLEIFSLLRLQSCVSGGLNQHHNSPQEQNNSKHRDFKTLSVGWICELRVVFSIEIEFH